MPIIEYSREFIALAECKSFSIAARKLNVSQPTLSRHMNELEETLGFRLLERNPVEFTQAGRRYLESVSAIISQLDGAIDECRAIDQGGDQVLRVYMLPSRSEYARILYEAASLTKERYPRFSLRPEYDSEQLTIGEAVEIGEAHMGVLFLEPAGIPEGFACEKLVDLPVCAWVHGNNPLLRQGRVRFSDLGELYLLRSTNRQSHMWHDAMVAAFRERGMAPRTRLKTLDDLSSFYMRLSPDEVLLDIDLGEDLNEYNSKLVKITFDDPPIMLSTYLYYNEASAGPLVKEFVRICHEVAQS